jgi:hypothetical protein
VAGAREERGSSVPGEELPGAGVDPENGSEGGDDDEEGDHY